MSINKLKHSFSFYELPDYNISILKYKFLIIFKNVQPVKIPREKESNLLLLKKNK